jgi:hypothetical protein
VFGLTNQNITTILKRIHAFTAYLAFDCNFEVSLVFSPVCKMEALEHKMQRKIFGHKGENTHAISITS